MRTRAGATVTVALLAAAALTGVTLADEPTAHDTHHPKTTKDQPAPSDRGDSTAASAMQQMQAMHAKMMAAKTPAERQALMADHMKAMQGGMQAMMQQMGMGAKEGGMSSQGMMQMRMDMMTMMMQMMMDRQQMRGMSMMEGSTSKPVK